MGKPVPKWMLKVLERPYSVRTPIGDILYFSDMREAHQVSHELHGVYSIFLESTRNWVPIGIMFDLPKGSK